MGKEEDMTEYEEEDIIEEIHDGRETLLGKFDGDLRALFDDARRRDEESGRKRSSPRQAAASTPSAPDAASPQRFAQISRVGSARFSV